MKSKNTIELTVWSQGRWVNKSINALDHLSQYSQYPVGVIKNFASYFEINCDKIVNDAILWRRNWPVLGENLDRLCLEKSFVRRDSLENKKSEDPHIFDSYCIAMKAGDSLSEICKELFGCIKKVDQVLSQKFRGSDVRFPSTEKIPAFRPQLIHYPSNGGFFSWHTHDLNPQRFGLIVNLSKKNRDYLSGSTRFRLDGDEISIEDHHDQGALAFFRYDIVHCVDPIKGLLSSREVDWNSGRWSAIMPVM